MSYISFLCVSRGGGRKKKNVLLIQRWSVVKETQLSLCTWVTPCLIVQSVRNWDIWDGGGGHVIRTMLYKSCSWFLKKSMRWRIKSCWLVGLSSQVLGMDENHPRTLHLAGHVFIFFFVCVDLIWSAGSWLSQQGVTQTPFLHIPYLCMHVLLFVQIPV